MKLKFLSVVICCALIAASCKKYENGPALSIFPKKIRAVNGWRCEKFSINNSSGTTMTRPEDIYCNFAIDKSAYYEMPSGFASGTWKFENKKKDIKFISDSGENKVFHILKLKETKLWFYEMVGNDKYEYHFKSDEKNLNLLE